MKVFQIYNNFCHWDATRQYSSAIEASKHFAADMVFVDAPDYVFVGWGYLDGEFVKPAPPDGWLYDDETGTFYEMDGARFLALKSTRIAETKTALETHLESHPLLWTDGKHYSVTAEKQALLNNAIAVYQIGAQAGLNPTLEWNATTEECTEWAFADLCALALGIAAYVKPLVAHQQALEAAIRAAETAEEVQAIEITYG